MLLFRWLKANLRQVVAILLIAGLYWGTRLPEISAAERISLSSRFHFQRSTLPQVPGYPSKSIRAVNPHLSKIAPWISSVGAAVALSDIDGDGLPNDICYVDPRIDQVIVSPVPGTPARYKPFVLTPTPLFYDSSRMAPMGCLPLDVNEDGLTDLVVYYWGRSPVLFLQRQSTSSGLSLASFVPKELLPSVQDWYTNAATAADLDGDGHVDLVFANYFADGSQILDAHSTVLAQMQDSMSRASNGGTKHFLLWNRITPGDPPSVEFIDQAKILEKEAGTGWTLALGACDLNGDLLPEIYIANDFGPDVLLYNRSTPGHLRFQRLFGKRTMTTPASKVLGHDSFKGMGVECGDLNQDGIPDLAVSNITSEFALEESNLIFLSHNSLKWMDLQMQQGIAPYQESSEPLGLARSGWSWDVRFGDFSNDGSLQILQAAGFLKGHVDRWPELHELAMGNDNFVHASGSWPHFRPGDDLSGHDHNHFFVRCASGRYVDLSSDLGLDEPQVTRGIAVADVDGDGLLDFALANQWEDSVFYHNDSKGTGNFLQLYLMLPLGQPETTTTQVLPGHPPPGLRARYAIGATASLQIPGGRRQIAEVQIGNGHSGKRSPELHFGLGYFAASETLPVEIRWRDVHGIPHRQTLALTPGLHTVLLGSAGKGIE